MYPTPATDWISMKQGYMASIWLSSLNPNFSSMYLIILIQLVLQLTVLQECFEYISSITFALALCLNV